MPHINLSKNQKTKVDFLDYIRFKRWKWKLHPNGYACRSGWDAENKKWLCVLLHRLITNAPNGLEVDHINGDKLDNRKRNLRLLSPKKHREIHVHRLVAYQKANKIYPDFKLCTWCGKNFKVNPRKRKRNKCCSFKCAQQMRINGRLRQCGKLQSSPKSQQP